ncbi:MAG: carboxymuconolactone decarboxylase family protein [Bacteriovoracaceae bacterium]
MKYIEKILRVNAQPEAQVLLDQVQKNYGFTPNLMSTFANSPATMKAYLTLGDLMSKTSFTSEEQQAVLLAASVENKCDYCVAAHSMMAVKMAGMSPETLNSLVKGENIANSKIDILVRLTKEIVKSRGFASESIVKDFLNAGYKQQHILEVILGVAMKTLSNYTNHLAETEIDEQFR